MSFFVSLTVYLVSVTGMAPPHRTAAYLTAAMKHNKKSGGAGASILIGSWSDENHLFK